MGKRNPEVEARWRERVSAWHQSGQSVRAFCQAHGLRENSFYGWRREIARRDGVEVEARPRSSSTERVARSTNENFIELAVTAGGVIEVAPDGTTRIPIDVEPDRLALVLGAVRRARLAC